MAVGRLFYIRDIDSDNTIRYPISITGYPLLSNNHDLGISTSNEVMTATGRK